MKIINLTENSNVYTSNVYLVLGTWNTIADVNTLIDVGNDVGIIEKIEGINTGLGKNKIDQVIITHSHSDHTGILPAIINKYNPMVYAFNIHLKGVGRALKDGDFITVGDRKFEIYHITAHSHDSICIYNRDEGVLFSGDTNFPIDFENKNLTQENALVLARLSKKTVKYIYPGHGNMGDFSNRRFQTINN